MTKSAALFNPKQSVPMICRFRGGALSLRATFFFFFNFFVNATVFLRTLLQRARARARSRSDVKSIERHTEHGGQMARTHR